VVNNSPRVVAGYHKNLLGLPVPELMYQRIGKITVQWYKMCYTCAIGPNPMKTSKVTKLPLDRKRNADMVIMGGE
jgi:hypothetical protein